MNNHSGHGDDTNPTDSTTRLYTGADGDNGGDGSDNSVTNLKLPGYRVIRELGKGGMGQVFLALQTEPVEREVAIKLILNRFRNSLNEQRFQVERQALAEMRHPAIAQIYDAGTNPDGFPYFAMEYVSGLPLMQFCSRYKLNLSQRLELFIRICQGVSHAHQKGIIHRDLKPANILVSLVDEVPSPKIIDFGIATAEASARERRFDSSVGTPVYMSPELFDDNSSIDTRSDIYSLGVILYELLTDQRPYDPSLFSETDTSVIRQNLARHSPQDPSTLISPDDERSRQSARDRQTSVRTLKRRLKGDLDCIARKAINPDRNERYASGPDLAEDVRRYLAREPVHAMGNARTYRLQRFLSRHAWAVSGISLIIAALTIGLAAALVGMTEAQRQQQIAENRQQELEKMIAFQQSMLGDIDPRLLGEGFVDRLRSQYQRSFDHRADSATVQAGIEAFDIAVGQTNPTDLAQDLIDEFLLQRAVASIERDFAEQPLLQADLYQSVRDVYTSAGMIELGLPLARKIVDLRLEKLGPEALETLQARRQLFQLLSHGGEYEEARTQLDEILARLDHRNPEQQELRHVTWDSLANLLVDIGEREEALSIAERNLAQVEIELGRHHERTVAAVNTLGYVHARSGRIETALSYFRDSLDRAQGHFDKTERTYFSALLNVGAALGALGHLEDALEIDTEVYEILSAHFGRRNPSTLRVMSNKAMTLKDLERFDEAQVQTQEILRLSRETYGRHNPLTLQVQQNLADLHLQMGQLELAVEEYREVALWRERLLTTEHIDTLFSYQQLARAYWKLGEFDQAIELMKMVHDKRLEILDPGHSQIRGAQRTIAELYRDMSETALELEWQERLVANLIEHEGLDEPWALRDALRLLALRIELGHHDRVEPLSQEIRESLGQDKDSLDELREEFARITHQTKR